MYDIVALGELLIDFTENGKSEAGNALYERNAGGAPANVLSAATKLGLRTAFIGKVGRDAHGEFLRDTLRSVGIDTAGLIEDERYFTTLAFVSIAPDGNRSFSFARKPGADTQLEEKELSAELLGSTKVFHFGSLSLTDWPAHDATIDAVRQAKEAEAIISYDPNYRKLLWRDEATAMHTMRKMLPLVDIVKVSDEELLLMTDSDDLATATDRLLGHGIAAVVVTLGKDGAYVATRDGKQLVPQRHAARAIDTTGAGDSFWGGVLTELVRSGKQAAELTVAELAAFADVGNAVASYCVERRGAILAMPTAQELAQRLK